MLTVTQQESAPLKPVSKKVSAASAIEAAKRKQDEHTPANHGTVLPEGKGTVAKGVSKNAPIPQASVSGADSAWSASGKRPKTLREIQDEELKAAPVLEIPVQVSR